MKILYCDYKLLLNKEDILEQVRKRIPDCEVECWQYTDEATFAEKVEDADGLLTAHLKISETILKQAAHLKVISVDGTGYGNVNTAAACKYGITVCSMGAYCTNEVADYIMMTILMLEKQMKRYMKQVESDYQYDYKLCQPRHRLEGKTLAVFGYGRIGKALAKRAEVFGYKVLAVSHNPKKAGTMEGDVRYVSAQEAFEKADVISNNMNETAETFEFFNKETFLKMKKHPLFINAARGSAVNETDLYDALVCGQLAGAALDVMKDVYPDLENCPLLKLDNVIITPHMAFYSVEAMESIKYLPVSNLINGLLNETDKISNIAV